jgi:CBS domain-containing protein
MKVEQIMTKDPACCAPEDDVEVAAEIMRRLDTGIVPVTKELSQPSKLLGVVTDRDLCLGVVAAGKDRTSIRVGELIVNQADGLQAFRYGPAGAHAHGKRESSKIARGQSRP